MAKSFAEGGGAFRLFRAWGIDVAVHWSWLIVAWYQINRRQKGSDAYDNAAWMVAEYLTLFGIVLLHEFGHALACRSVGGRADRIILWPLGGVAFVRPPNRPGAVLWSIVAGPLVNVVLALVLWPLPELLLTANVSDDVVRYAYMVRFINLVLLVFNLLPIYPLDGGKILWALLWFVVGRARGLMAAAVIGLVGAAGLALWALSAGSLLLGLLAAFAAWQAWHGVKEARATRQVELAGPRADAACPACRTPPPAGPFWKCGACGVPFDTFATGGVCPACAAAFNGTACPACGQPSAIADWYGPRASPVIQPPPPPRPVS